MRQELKVLRVRNNLTQAEMAERLNVGIATYNLIENGKRNGSKDLWVKLQQEFNLNDAEVWQMQK